MIYERLKLMHDLLAEDGSIYVHCDYRVNGYIRQVLDQIFGPKMFNNMIVWKRATMSGAKAVGKQYGRNYDTILYYTKTENYIFNRQHVECSQDY